MGTTGQWTTEDKVGRCELQQRQQLPRCAPPGGQILCHLVLFHGVEQLQLDQHVQHRLPQTLVTGPLELQARVEGGHQTRFATDQTLAASRSGAKHRVATGNVHHATQRSTVSLCALPVVVAVAVVVVVVVAVVVVAAAAAVIVVAVAVNRPARLRRSEKGREERVNGGRRGQGGSRVRGKEGEAEHLISTHTYIHLYI